MKLITLLLFALFISNAAISQHDCLTTENLIKLDSKWEQSLLESNVEILTSLLADNFLWVHNHAGTVDSKSEVLERASDPKRGAAGNTKSRISNDVKVLISGSTAVVTGFTKVDRNETITNYNFMRTYAKVEGKCYLMANHTMAIPAEED